MNINTSCKNCSIWKQRKSPTSTTYKRRLGDIQIKINIEKWDYEEFWHGTVDWVSLTYINQFIWNGKYFASTQSESHFLKLAGKTFIEILFDIGNFETLNCKIVYI